MRQLFILFTSLVLISSGTSQVMVFNKIATDNFASSSLWNLSRWDDKQKNIIAQSYLKSASIWYQSSQSQPSTATWFYWVNDGSSENAINTSFKLVNPAFSTGFVAYVYRPLPLPVEDLKQALAKGVNLMMKALPKKSFTGELQMTIKGNI